jgi:D-alanyl-lipoteichoic acid acyltransferase DltB (MBOAT superfamily)
VFEWVNDLLTSEDFMQDAVRLPIGPNGYILFALILPFLPRLSVRPFLIATSLLTMGIALGWTFALGIFAGVVGVWGLSELLATVVLLSGHRRTCIAIGWLILHAIFLPLCFVKLRGVAQMVPGDLTLFCGIGFMLLRSVHYLWDRCNDVLPRGKFDHVLLYMTFLPTFRMGPLDRFDTFNSEINDCQSRISPKVFMLSVGRVALGTAKMLVIGLVIDRFYLKPLYGESCPIGYPWLPFAPGVFEKYQEVSYGHLWLTTLCYWFRDLLFFMGYADVAIGTARAMGIRVSENFDYPLISKSVGEFWRRWHMSFGWWLRNYVYIPLGGNRRNVHLNTTVVFLYCGLWHFPFIGGVWFGLQVGAYMAIWRIWAAAKSKAFADQRGVLWRLKAAGLLETKWTGVISIAFTQVALALIVLPLFDRANNSWEGLRMLRALLLPFWPH